MRRALLDMVVRRHRYLHIRSYVDARRGGMVIYTRTHTHTRAQSERAIAHMHQTHTGTCIDLNDT